MKAFLSTSIIFSLIASASWAQVANLNNVTENYSSERMGILRSTLALKDSDENIFWSLYDQYEQRLQSSLECTLLALNQLQDIMKKTDPQECVNQVFENQLNEVRLKKEYFDKINANMNGTVAFKFLQSEALTELLLKSKLYERLNGDHPQWDKKMVRDEQFKFSSLELALNIAPEQREKLKAFFDDFEFEYSRVVGHQLIWFEQYVEDVSELTPAQCKQMGIEFLQMQFNEVKVKKKFFTSISDSLDEDLAARFVALEDYFSMMAKLKAWSDNMVAAR